MAVFIRYFLKLIGLGCIVILLSYCSEPELPAEEPITLPANSCNGLIDYGYTDKVSYSPGDKVKVFMQATEEHHACRLAIYKLDGSLAFEVRGSLVKQDIDPIEPYTYGYGFGSSTEFELPLTLSSGIYLVDHKIPFIVKSVEPADILVVYPSNTANAYCESGGKSLYTSPDRARVVSFLRPIELQDKSIFCLHWFDEIKNASVGYLADADMDDYKNIEGNKLLVIIGHSEYWTREARQNFDRFVDEGGDALILSGNTMWWQVRYQKNNSQLVCYKDASDPTSNPLLKTVNWIDPSLNYPILSSIGADFQHGGYGLTVDEGWDGYKIVSQQSPLLEGLNLKKGDIIRLPSGEYDGAMLAGLDDSGDPVLNNSLNKFYKIELIGYDKGMRFKQGTVGTFIVLQKQESSGIIVNTASYDWCSKRGMGGNDGQILKTITANAINKLLNEQPVFSN